MEPINPDPLSTESLQPTVASEIPSAVGAAGQKPWLPIVGLCGGACLVMMVMRSPKKAETAGQPKDTATPSPAAQSQTVSSWPPPMPPAIPAAMAQAWAPLTARANAAVQPMQPSYSASPSYGSVPTYSGGGERALMDVRDKSPMVIYNNNSGGGPSAGGAGTPGGGILAAGTLGAGTGAPLPANFHPNAGGSEHTTDLGDREYIIAQGKLLDAVLETGINSDHPGMLRALMSDDIYGDSGRTVLLPRGTRLIGQYNSSVAKGQNRVFVLWQRAIRPDGIAIELGSAGTDSLGVTGIEGSVNNHFFMMFGAATLLSIIGGAASTVDVAANSQPNSVAAYREGVTQGFANASNTVLSEYTRIQPTITVRPGVSVKVFVAKDLYFDTNAMREQGIRVIQ